VIGHGRSNPVAIKNAMRVAVELYRNRVNEKIDQELSAVAAAANMARS
jgi:fatty acid/phospholipid biosynthesis enzyme